MVTVTTSEYFATEIYRQREKEMVRNLERRRIIAERLESSPAHAEPAPGLASALGVRWNRLQTVVRHQTARG